MICNPFLGASASGTGAETILGTCELHTLDSGIQSYPIYQGIPPLDHFVAFNSYWDIQQTNASNAEYVAYGALESGDYVFFRNVQPDDAFRERE